MTKSEFYRQLDEAYEDFNNNFGMLLRFKLHTPQIISQHSAIRESTLELMQTKNYNNKEEIEFLSEELEQIKDFPKIIYSMSLVYVVAHFEVYLGRITRILLTYFWKTLRTKSKSLTLEEILSYDSIDSLKEQIIEDELYKISYKSIRDRISYMEDKFGLAFTYKRVKGVRNNWNCLELDDLVEIHSTRNIIIHNNAIVNNIYLRDNPDSTLKTGEPKVLNKEYVIKSVFTLFRVTNSLYKVSKKKIDRVKTRKKNTEP